LMTHARQIMIRCLKGSELWSGRGHRSNPFSCFRRRDRDCRRQSL
jgi:hypothetical protein